VSFIATKLLQVAAAFFFLIIIIISSSSSNSYTHSFWQVFLSFLQTHLCTAFIEAVVQQGL
jgi:general stress protein CsbA